MAQRLITALVLRADSAEWTTVKLVKGQVDVVSHQEVPLEPAGAEPVSPGRAAALKSALGRTASDLCVATPPDKVLMRVVDLPTADAAEMRGMAELQVDKFSPFPVEHLAISLEVLSQKENSSRVLIAAIQRDLITALGEGLGKAGLRPHWIDVEVMGWWYLLKEQGQVPDKGRRVFLLLDTSGTDLVISQDGIPVVFRSLGAAAGLSEGEYYSEIADEVGYTLTALEAERGTAEGARLSLWTWGNELPPKLVVPGGAQGPAQPAAGEPSRELVSKLREVCAVDVETRRLESLPPLSEGLARRALLRRGFRLREGYGGQVAGQAAARGAMMLDLAPAEWRSREQARSTYKSLLVATAVFLVVWLTGVSAFVGGLAWQKSRLLQVKNTVSRMEGPAEEIRTLKEKVASFEQYADRSHSMLECLREVTELLTPGIDLTSFVYRKGNSVSLRGEADSAEPIYNFFQAMEKSPLFVKVKPEAVRQKNQGGVSKSEFSLTADLPGGEEKP